MFSSRPTIGLLIGNTWHSVSWDMWAGVDAVTREQDVNLLCFAGDDLHTPVEFSAQANVLYDLVSVENVDGLVIWGGGLGQYVDPEEVRAFCEKYRPLPMVNAASPLEDIPSVLVDNYQGMRALVTHLVEVHGYQRIAFIGGPEDHPEAIERYRAYADVLAEYGLPLDPNLVAPGDFNPDSGMEAINLLLDRRELRPPGGFEAVVAADDGMAISAMQALQARGIRLPDEVAVTGFDNIEEGWYTAPSLTTAPALVYEQARQATEMVLALLEGGTVPDRVILPTHVVVRESCGCVASAAEQTAVGTAAMAGETLEAALAGSRADILSKMVQAVETAAVGVNPAGAEQLLDAFLTELSGSSSHLFLSTLDEVLLQGVAAGGSVTVWLRAISVLSRYVLSYLNREGEAPSGAEGLLQKAQTLIGETAQRAQVHHRLRFEQQAQELNEVSQSLTATFDLAELMNTAAEGLEYLDIESASIALYENPESPTEWSRLVMAYNRSGRVALEAEGQRFPSRQLVPDGLWHPDRRYGMVVEPLYFQDDQLGFALFEADPRKATLYDALRGHISSALKGTLLIQERERAKEALVQSASLLQATLESTTDGILVVDRAGKIVNFNQRFVEMWRIPEDVIISRSDDRVLEFVLDQLSNPDEFVTKVGELYSRPEMGIFDNLCFKDGRIFERYSQPQRVGDEIVGRVWSFRDVTGQKRAEEALERRATQLAIINDIGGKIAAVLKLDGVLARAARLVQESFGYHHVGLFTLNRERGELMMRTRAGDLAHLFPPDHRLKLQQGMVGWVGYYGKMLLANDVEAEPRYVNLYPDVIPTRSELSVPIGVGGEIIGVLDVQSPRLNAFDENDVMVIETLANQIAVAMENARLYEETSSRAERLATANRIAQAANEELETFAYSISHDLRAPLRHIDGFVRLLLKREEGRLDSTSSRYLNNVAESSDKMGQMIDDLLNFSRTGRAEVRSRRVELDELVREARQTLEPEVEGRSILWEIGPLPAVEADPALLRRVWVNLLSNAIKFTASRSEARIEIGMTRDGECEEDEVAIFVRDNGVGFDPQYTHKLFSVFQRLHRDDEFEGTGIGLATVRRIIHRHGGRVWAEGEPDRGATFYFTLKEATRKQCGSEENFADRG